MRVIGAFVLSCAASMPCKKIKTSHPLADGGENGVVEPSAPPALGRRTIRGKRGALKDMPNMPVDIVIEVRMSSTIERFSSKHL